MKRKALAITLAAVMAMGTCAVTASAADGDTYTIGICQLVQHVALDAATQGFKDEVTKELGEDAVTFDEQNAQGDSNTCSTIVNSFVSNNVDLILANATPALQAAAAGILHVYHRLTRYRRNCRWKYFRNSRPCTT